MSSALIIILAKREAYSILRLQDPVVFVTATIFTSLTIQPRVHNKCVNHYTTNQYI